MSVACTSPPLSESFPLQIPSACIFPEITQQPYWLFRYIRFKLSTAFAE